MRENAKKNKPNCMREQTKKSTASRWLLSKFLLASMLLSVLSLASCKSQQIVETVTRTEKELVRDTTIVLLPDSASIIALFECDSMNKVVMNELDRRTGERITPSMTVHEHRDGSMDVKFSCNEDSLEQQIAVRDRIIEELRQNTQIKEVEKPLSKWDSFCIVCGYILMGLFFLGLVIFLVIIILKLCKR